LTIFENYSWLLTFSDIYKRNCYNFGEKQFPMKPKEMEDRLHGFKLQVDFTFERLDDSNHKKCSYFIFICCVKGCWDWTPDCSGFSIDSQTRVDLIRQKNVSKHK
jgi:hypothetical protein